MELEFSIYANLAQHVYYLTRNGPRIEVSPDAPRLPPGWILESAECDATTRQLIAHYCQTWTGKRLSFRTRNAIPDRELAAA